MRLFILRNTCSESTTSQYLEYCISVIFRICVTVIPSMPAAHHIGDVTQSHSHVISHDSKHDKHEKLRLQHTMKLWMKHHPFHLLLSWWPTTPSWPGSPSWEWLSPSSVCPCASSPSGSSVRSRAQGQPSTRTCAAASSWPSSSSWWESTWTHIRWARDAL